MLIFCGNSARAHRFVVKRSYSVKIFLTVCMHTMGNITLQVAVLVQYAPNSLHHLPSSLLSKWCKLFRAYSSKNHINAIRLEFPGGRICAAMLRPGHKRPGTYFLLSNYPMLQNIPYDTD